MNKSHAADWAPGSPSPAQLKEFFDQIDSGRVTKDTLQSFLRDGTLPSTPQMEALKIIGERSSFHTGYVQDITDRSYSRYEEAFLERVPWPRETLEQCRGTHVLFPGQTFNLSGMVKLAPKLFEVEASMRPHGFYSRWRLDVRWYLVRKACLDGTVGLTLEEVDRLVPPDEVGMSAFQIVFYNMLAYLGNKRYSSAPGFPRDYIRGSTWTRSQLDSRRSEGVMKNRILLRLSRERVRLVVEDPSVAIPDVGVVTMRTIPGIKER